jgi:hypothetical protein
VLLQYPDDLFFGVSAALHRPSPSRNGLYLKSRAISGSRSGGLNQPAEEVEDSIGTLSVSNRIAQKKDEPKIIENSISHRRLPHS